MPYTEARWAHIRTLQERKGELQNTISVLDTEMRAVWTGEVPDGLVGIV